MSRSKAILLALTGLGLTGCVAAVPAQPTLTVIPGQGKTEAMLRADDASCRVDPTGTGNGTNTAARTRTDGAATTTAPITADQYYACMAAHGQTVIEQRTEAYPAYAGYGYPYAYPAYAYGYPYVGYPYGYGYPFYGPYFGPYVGFGVGFGYGRFYGGRGFYGGYRGGYGGYRGGYGGFHGGGPGGGFHGGHR